MVKAIGFIFMMLSVITVSPVWAADVTGLQALYSQTQSWQADFTQTTHVDLIDKTITKTGSIVVAKPGKLKIDYQGESARHYLLNGETLWVHDEGVDQVLEYKKISKILASEALTFLKGLGNLSSDFVVSDYGQDEAMMQDKSLKLIQLVSKKKDSQIEKIVLGVSGKNQIEELTLFNESQNKNHYTLRNIRFNPTLNTNAFELDQALKKKIVKGE